MMCELIYFIAGEGGSIEVIFVSSDRSQQEQESYLRVMKNFKLFSHGFQSPFLPYPFTPLFGSIFTDRIHILLNPELDPGF
jgi:hypothetical protein